MTDEHEKTPSDGESTDEQAADQQAPDEGAAAEPEAEVEQADDGPSRVGGPEETEDFLSELFDHENGHDIEVYEEHGGYEAMREAFDMGGDEIVGELKESNLRGRGGAGFPAGIKWSFIPDETEEDKYLVVNADEGEPGTFKDRQIMEHNPHALIEGIIIACWALDIRYTYIYVRGELQFADHQMQRAIEQAYEKGYLGEDILGTGFDLDVWTHISAGAYICGEETGMIEGLEGKPGKPRIKPPFPAVVGVFDKPTLVNNVETIAYVPLIVERGGDWFADYGSEKNGGPKLYGLSGPVNNPGVYEAPSGITVGELLEDYAGGMRDGHELKAYIPGGSSTAALTPDQLDLEMAFEPMREVGSNLGTGCVTFLDQDTCMVRVAARLAHFYHHESCGQCTPCRDGTGWAAKVLDALEAGRGRSEDIELLEDMTGQIEHSTICALGPSLTFVVHSYLDKFREDFERHVEEGGCPYPDWSLEDSTAVSRVA
jgi:NADH-quinone oxidoreductase subunit F